MIPPKGSYKKHGYSQLKRLLDHFFSVWVRRRWADSTGLASCITCGSRRSWKELQCGHFVSRVHLATRWHERNAAPQCSACNVLRRGNMAEYSIWISKKYGPGIAQELVDLKNKTVKFHRSQLEKMIDDFKGRIADLDSNRSGPTGGKEVGDNELRLHGQTSDDIR